MQRRKAFSLAKELISGTGFFWLAMTALSSIVLALVEYGMAGVLQLMSVHLNVMDASKIPALIQPYLGISFGILCIVLVVIGVVKSVGLFYSAQSTVVFNQLVNARMRSLTAFELLVGKEEEFLSAAEVHTRFGEIYPKAGNCILQVSGFLNGGVQLVFLFVGMFVVAPHETAVSMVALLSVGLVMRFINRKIIGAASEISVEQHKISEAVERVTRNWLFVRISGTQKSEFNHLNTGIASYYKYNTDTSLFATINSIIPSFFGAILIAILLYASHVFFGTSGGLLIAFIYLFTRFVQQLGVTVTCLSMALTFWPQLRRVVQILEKSHPDERKVTWQLGQQLELTENTSDRVDLSNLPAPGIKVNNVTFTYKGRTSPVLENLSINVRPGKMFAIVGPSGGGKTTLLLTILGLLKPSTGDVTFDDKYGPEYISKYRRRISYVGVEPFLIEGSIRDNLKYGLTDQISDDDLWSALRDAHVSEVVKELPGQLDFILNEHAMGLSAGQKQRVALARALVKKPVLLILDEATSNLDVETEKLVRESLEKLDGRCTVIAVSHRQGILTSADTTCRLGPI